MKILVTIEIYEKKKILIIHSLPSPYRNPLLQRLAKDSEFDVTIFFMAKSAKNRIWDTKELPFKHKFLSSYTLNIKLGDDIIPIWNNPTIPWEIAKGNYDLVICSGWDSTTTFLARITCFLLKIPTVVWAGSTANEKSIQRTLMHFPVKFLVKSCAAIIAYGKASKQYLLSLGVDERNIFISYNSVDIELYKHMHDQTKNQKQKIRKKLGIKNKYLILFVGQLIKRKGVLDLFEAVSRLQQEFDIGALWVGYGPLEATLKEKSKSSSAKNHYFQTTRTAQATAHMYAIADLFILPSHEDIYSNVIAEALSSGLPVISTQEAGASIDYVKSGENGYTFRAGDVDQLTAIIRYVITNDDLLKSLSDNTWDLVKNFNYTENIKVIKKMIHTLTA